MINNADITDSCTSIIPPPAVCALYGGYCSVVKFLKHRKSNPIRKPKLNEQKHCRNSCGIKETLMHSTIPNSPHLTGLSVLRKMAMATAINKVTF